MDDYYTSKSTFFVSNPNITERLNLYKTEATEGEIHYFGNDEEIDRTLSIAQSALVIQYISDKYNLKKHYGIDTTKSFFRSKTEKKIKANYQVQKTTMGAIEVRFEDKDPELAAQIVNDIVDKIDKIKRNLLISTKSELAEFFRQQLKDKQLSINVLRDSITNSSAQNSTHKHLLESQYTLSITEFNDISKLYHQYQGTAQLKTSSIFLLEEATPSERKSRPFRTLIVLGCTFLSLFLMSLFLILRHRTN